MDFDSSSKFISSLAKFLQSLCNGYVEFDSGVHVIGHLYLSVDTGKTIDYVLNEKVCKTDENSVTFISNSFHAEPAEKPKPPGRKDDKDKQDRLERENGDGNVEQLEPRSTNYGTIPNARGSPNGKRPHSPGRVSPRSKKSRINSSEPSNISNDNVHSPSVDGGHGQNVPQDSSYNDSYPQTFFPPADEESTTGDPERDVKPSLDTDVTFIKEEIAAESQASHDRNQFDDPYISSMFPPSNQSHPSGGFPSNFGASPSSQRTSFGPMGERHPGMLPPGQNSSQLEPGENPNDPSAILDSCFGLKGAATMQAPFFGSGVVCQHCGKRCISRRDLEGHINTVHLKLKPFVCPCGKGFAYNRNLHVHKKVCSFYR